MSTLIPIKTRIELARSFFRDVANVNDFLYVFFGHTTKWDMSDTVPTLTDTKANLASVHQNILAVKRVQLSDIVFMIRREDWLSGTTYDRYDDVVNLSSKNFYVYNPDNFCIYKCLNRQDYIDGSVAVSSVNIPTSTTPEKFSTADGYWWRLVYFVPAADRLKFLTSTLIPVRFYSSSTIFDCSGIIEKIDVTNGGTGYTEPPAVIITGDGKGAAAQATINSDGSVDSVSIVCAECAGGSGYTWAEISFQSESGTGAVAVPTLISPDIPDSLNVDIAAAAQATAGSIDFVDILNINTSGRGSNYTPETIFQVIGDGKNATVSVTFVEEGTGNIDSISTEGVGLNYTFASIQTIGDGNDAELKPIISPLYGHGGNVPNELFATTLCISVDLEDYVSDFFIGNDYRQVGLIKNIKKYGVNGTIFDSLTGNGSYVMQVTDPSNYNNDDEITTDSGGIFTVVAVSGNFVKLLPSIDFISEASVLFNVTTSGSLASIVEGSLVSPEINTKTGDIIYLQNMAPITRQANQTETFTTFLNF